MYIRPSVIGRPLGDNRMKTNRDTVLEWLAEHNRRTKEQADGITTQELSALIGIQRANLSTILNRLVDDGLVEKDGNRPVKYRLKVQESGKDRTVFGRLAGADNSMKNAVQLAKAAILYPENPLPTVLIGEEGVGKCYFASLMYEFSREKEVIPRDTEFYRVNGRDFTENEEEFAQKLMDSGKFLFVNGIHLLSLNSRRFLWNYLDHKTEKGQIVICTLEHESVIERADLTAGFPMKIHLPTLSERDFSERFELIRTFFMEEALKMGRELKANSELLSCLLLYHCEGEVKQLRNDIRIGCANAYVRELNSRADRLNLYLHDFPDYVRQGLLLWKACRDELTAVIPRNSSFSFTGENVETWKNSQESADYRESIYDLIERKEKELRSQGVAEEDIGILIGADLEKDLKKLTHRIEEASVNENILGKIVKPQIIGVVRDFLDIAGETLGRVFPTSVFYGLCLHISSFMQHTRRIQHLTGEKVAEIIDNHREEYELARLLAKTIEQDLQVRLPMDEIAVISMFLYQNEGREELGATPVLLIAMHGNTAASSIKDVINSLAMAHNVYAFDCPLDVKMNEMYQTFVEYVRSIHRGKGIIMIYDMGSMRTMGELAMQETGIQIRFIEVPITLIGLECSRRALGCNNVDELYEEIKQSCKETFSFVKESYERIEKDKLIITLCMTGQGGALQMKNYLEKNLSLKDVGIVALAVSDQEALLRELNRLMEKHEILCLIGTYDPKLYRIPFVSVAQLFSTPIDKLPLLLALSEAEMPVDVDYDTVYEYLSEQLPELDTKKLRRHLPKAIVRIKKMAGALTEAQELGLFMHIACSVGRIQTGEENCVNREKDRLIAANKKMYHNLKEILQPMELSFHIEYSDDELANIIKIIKCV